VKAGSVVAKNGDRVQLYRCNGCRRHFSVRKGYGHKKRNAQEIIDYAVALSKNVDPAYSTRDISRILFMRFQVKVSHVGVHKWLCNAPATQSMLDSIVGIPCLKCLLTNEVSPYSCVPGTCERMEKWALAEVLT